MLDTSGGALTQITRIAAGGSHSLALKSDGTVWMWGAASPQFGSTGNVAFQVQDPLFRGPQVTSIVAIAAGAGHDLAVKSDGTVLAWGSDDRGQLGDNGISNTYSTMPHFVRFSFTQPLTDVTAVAAGGAHSLALKSDGTVWAWGDNSFGELGSSTASCGGGFPNTPFPCSTVPLQVPSLSGVLAIAAGGGHSLAVERARASLAPASLTFPDTKVNTASGSQMVTLTNSGPGPIGIGPILVSAGFSKSATGFPNTCGSVLPQGQSCRIDINFTPTAVGPFSGTLMIIHDGFGAAQPVTLSGRGIAPIASLSSTSLTFGSQPYLTASPVQRVTLTNTGDANLVFKSTAFSFNRPDFITTDYSVPSTSFTCVGLSTLTPGQSCFVDVAFYPYTAGSIVGSLTFFHDAGAGTSTVNLSGTGLAPVASASPAHLEFDKQPLGAPSPSQVVTLTNTGSGNLHVKSTRGVYLSTPEPQEFWLLPGTDGCTGATLSPNQTCTVGVYFMPVRGPSLKSSATLVFDSDAGNGAQLVALDGSSLPPSLDVSPHPLDFGKQPIGSPAPVIVLRFTNISGTAITPLLNVDGPRAADFRTAAPKCPPVLNPGDVCFVEVGFAPSVKGVEAANLIVIDGATGVPAGGVQLSGFGS